MYRHDEQTDPKPAPRHEPNPVRSELVAQARLKVDAGDYNRPEVLELVVDRLLTSLVSE